MCGKFKFECAVVAAGLLALCFASPARATSLVTVSPSGGSSVLEGSGAVPFSYTVTNNDGNTTLMLDYAFVGLSYSGPDTTDVVSYPTLTSAALYILPGQSVVYSYYASTTGNPACVPGDCDYGITAASFSIELSPYGIPGGATVPKYGQYITPPPGNSAGIVGFNPFAAPSSQPGPLALLQAGVDPCLSDPACNPANPPVADLLYTNGILGLPDPAVVLIRVNDTPVPAALPLFATGMGALGLLGWRRKRKAQAAIAA